MNFKMNAVIHKGQNYENSLRIFQNKRMEYVERELKTFDTQTLYWLINSFRRSGHTMAQMKNMAV